MNFASISPYFGAIGQSLLDLDEDSTGADDFAGALLVYVAEVTQSITDGVDLPPFPETLTKGTTDKISGTFKAVLIVVNSALTVARFQSSGKASAILKYATQALSNLIGGRPVPPAPAAVK